MKKRNQDMQTQRMKRMGAYALPDILLMLGGSFGAYGTLFQQRHGFTTQMTGWVTGATLLMTVVGNYLSSRIGDKTRSVKRITILMTALSVFAIAMIPLSTYLPVNGKWLIFAFFAFSGLAVAPTSMLLENWLLRSSFDQNFDYGVSKALGSGGALLGHFLSSAILIWLGSRLGEIRSVHAMYYIDSGLYLLTIPVMLSLKDASGAEKERVNRTTLDPRRLIRIFDYSALVLLYFLAATMFNAPYTFLPVLMEGNHLNPEKLGIVAGATSVAQILLLFFFSKLSRRVRPRLLVSVGVAFYAASVLAFAGAGSMAGMMVGTMFYGVASALTTNAAYVFIYQLAPQQLQGTAQSIFAVGGSLGGAIGNFAAGGIIARFGVHTYFRSCGLCLVLIVAGYLLITTLRTRLSENKESL